MTKYATLLAFERTSVCTICLSQTLYTRLGEHINPDNLNDALSSLLLRALRSVTQGTGGRVPSNVHIVLQQIRTWVDDGKVTMGDFLAAEELIFCSDATMDDDAYVEAWLPHLQRQALKDIAQRSIGSYQQGSVESLRSLGEAMEQASRIGVATNSAGISLTTGLDEALDSTAMEVVTTGVPDLDILLQGGMIRGTLTMFLGGPNSGKSMELTNCAAANVLNGYNVAMATLENARAIQMARTLAAMVGIPTEALSRHRSQVEHFLKTRPHGELIIEYFPPIITRIATIRQWVSDQERATGKRFDIVIIDYTDKVGSHRQEKGEYESQRTVCETFRDWVTTENRWGATATQATRKKRDAPELTVLDEADVADSQHKIRIADVMISINPRPMSYYWWIIRHRLVDVNKQGVEAPHERSICRMGKW